MPNLSDSVLDAALAVIQSDASDVHLCSDNPGTYAEATDTFSLGSGAVTVGAPAANTPSGRQVEISGDGEIAFDGTGTATHWALVNTAGTELLAVGEMAAPESVEASTTRPVNDWSVAIEQPS